MDQLDFLASENQVAVVSQLEMTVKKNGRKVSTPKFVQIFTFNATGKVTRLRELYDPTPFLAAWRG